MIVVKIHLEDAEIGDAIISKSNNKRKPQDQEGATVVVIVAKNQVPVVSHPHNQNVHGDGDLEQKNPILQLQEEVGDSIHLLQPTPRPPQVLQLQHVLGAKDSDPRHPQNLVLRAEARTG